jgi:DNA-binding transcriptional regulator PaaX
MAKKPSIQKAILKILADRKAISLDTVKESVEKAILAENEGNKAEYAITRSMKNLVSDGLVEAFNSEHRQYFRLTANGKQKLNNITLDTDSSLVSTHWDGYWRIVLLDLPEDRKSEREALRYLLKKAGFVCVKNSVWISMYPFEHLFTNIKNDLSLTTEMMILVTDKLDKETEEEFLKLIKK